MRNNKKHVHPYCKKMKISRGEGLSAGQEKKGIPPDISQK